MKQNSLLFYSFLLCLAIFASCTQNTNISTFANENESTIINELSCWSSYSAERTMLLITITSNEKELDNRWEKWHKEINEAKKNGQKLLLNDTLFISCIRNDSLYNSLLSQRKKLTAKLLKHKSSLPKFKETITKICNEVVEYKYHKYSNAFGLYEESFQDSDNYSYSKEKYYNDYSELLKEAFTESSSNISDEDLISMNNLLKEIEKIDRHIWCVPYYVKAMDELKTQNLKEEKNEKFESLTQ